MEKEIKLLFFTSCLKMLCSVIFSVSVAKLHDGMSQTQFETRDSRITKVSFVLDQEGVFLDLLCGCFGTNAKDILDRIE